MSERHFVGMTDSSSYLPGNHTTQWVSIYLSVEEKSKGEIADARGRSERKKGFNFKDFMMMTRRKENAALKANS